MKALLGLLATFGLKSQPFARSLEMHMIYCISFGAPAFSTLCLFQSFLNRVLDKRNPKSALDAEDLRLVPVPHLSRRKGVALQKPKSFGLSSRL